MVSILTIFVLSCVLGALATPFVQRNYEPNCGKVSFNQIGENSQIFSNEDVSKRCYHIRSAEETIVSLRTRGCPFQLVAFATPNCDDESYLKSYSFNTRQATIKLNDRKPVCSFFVPKLPRDDKTIRVTFKKYLSKVTHYVSRAQCHNLCGRHSNSYNPRTVELNLANGKVAEGYSIWLFSKTGCKFEDKIGGDSTAMARHGTNLVSFTQQGQTVLSYRIVRGTWA